MTEFHKAYVGNYKYLNVVRQTESLNLIGIIRYFVHYIVQYR